MGKSLNGKELGNGISQRKDGLYQAHLSIVSVKDRQFMQKL